MSSSLSSYRGRLGRPLSHGGTFAATAALVLGGDHLTKWLALTLWTGEATQEVQPLLGDAVGIHLVHNSLGAFSTSVGSLTWEFNVGATIAAILLAIAIHGRMAAFDSLAPTALGLVAGAGMGNLTSLVSSPSGVADFLALRSGPGSMLVLNFADIAAYLGLALCLRLAWSIVRAVGERSDGVVRNGG